MKRFKKTAHPGMMLMAVAFLVLGLAGSALAHPDITLRDATGAAIADPGFQSIDPADANFMQYNLAPAFSAKETCGACHGDKGTYPNLLSYDEIEKHSYHTQLGANQLAGWNPWNPDSANKFKKGVGPKGKPWVQSPGHFGKW